MTGTIQAWHLTLAVLPPGELFAKGKPSSEAILGVAFNPGTAVYKRDLYAKGWSMIGALQTWHRTLALLVPKEICTP